MSRRGARPSGPLPARAVVGTATVADGRTRLARIALVAARARPAVSGLTHAVRPARTAISIVTLVLALGGILFLSARERGGPGGAGHGRGSHSREAR